MEYQSFGRPQRPKGACIKHAMKAILVVAVCAWLGYQTNNTMKKTKNYGFPRIIVEAELLGRKGIPTRLNEGALPDSQDVDSAEEAIESNDGRDEVFDGARQDKVEEEIGHINGKFGTNEGGSVLNVSQSKYKEFEVKRREKQSAVQIRNNAKSQIRNNARSDFSTERNDRDSAEETRTQESVVQSYTNTSATEKTDKVLSFSDENGVPPDGDEIKSVVDLAQIMHEVTSREDDDVKVNLEASKNVATADQEFNSMTFTHTDTSGINDNSETGEGDSQVL